MWLISASIWMLVLATFVQAVKMHKRTIPTVLSGWGLWTFVNAVSWAAQASAGSTELEQYVPMSQLACTLGLTVVALWVLLRDNNTRFWTISDAIASAACLIGLIFWLSTDEPLVAIFGNVGANLAGLFPIWNHARKTPGSVAKWYWSLRGTSSCLAGAAFADPHNFYLIGFIPQATGLFICLAMLTVSWFRPRKKAPSAA